MELNIFSTYFIYSCSVFLAPLPLLTQAQPPTPTAPGTSNLKPLVFLHDAAEIFVVRMVWNPTMDIEKIIELSQREVSYSWDQVLDGPAPQFQPWRRLVREDQNHDGSRRYAFVKDDQCREVDFRLGWITSKGEKFENIIQTLKPIPIVQPMNAVIKLKNNIIYDETSGLLKAMVDWEMDTSSWDKIQREKAKPKVSVETCRSIFHEPIPHPEIMKGGQVIEIDSRYAQHGCELKVTLDFLTFDNDTDCYATYESQEFLMIKPECGKIKGLKCPKPDYSCDMNCSPDINLQSYFELDGNETLLFANATWQFPPKLAAGGGKTQKPIPAQSVQVRYFHSWLNFNQQPFENENVTVQILDSPADNTMMLPALSVTPQALWVLQICQIYDKKCPKPDWTKVPLYPVWYYKMHDELPPWVAASIKAAKAAEKAEKAAASEGRKGGKEGTEISEEEKGAELPKKAAMKDVADIGLNSAAEISRISLVWILVTLGLYQIWLF